jgi:hypothetical protein
MRMIKRRNSPYASHDRNAKRHEPMDYAAVMLQAMPLTGRNGQK